MGPNPARMTAVNGGVPVDSPAVSVNVRCGSSIQALIMGSQAIKAEDVDTVMVGGTESSNQVPYGLLKARWGYRMGKGEVVDLLHHDGFQCPLGGGLMGELTDAYAAELGITREEQDEFAADCHNKTEAAAKATSNNSDCTAVSGVLGAESPVAGSSCRWHPPAQTSQLKLSRTMMVFDLALMVFSLSRL